MITKSTIAIIIFIISMNIHAQDDNEFSSADNDKTSLQGYTPSVMLKKGQYEIKTFNNLYTQTSYFDDGGSRINQSERNTFFTNLTYFLYGVSDNLNVGVEVWLRSVRNDSENSSPFAVFQFESGSASRTAISRIGPKIKFAPFAGTVLRRVSVQSTLLFPTAANLSGAFNGTILPYLDDDAYLFINQFFYDVTINESFSYFGELDTWIRVDRDFNGRGNGLQLPVKSFLSYYPTGDVTIYGMLEFLHEWSRGFTSYYTQAGLGIKYQLVPNLELEGLVTSFFIGRNKGAGQTFNLGFRIVN